MQKKQFYTTQLMKLGLQILLYGIVFAAFFGLMAITSPALLRFSRTAAITMAAFIASLLMLTTVYGGFDIGLRTRRTVFGNIALSLFFTDLVSYITLQIMNTNPSNPEAHSRFVFFSTDLLLLAAVGAVQLIALYILVTVGQKNYFRINPPQKCCVITSDQATAEHVALKMSWFPQRYSLGEVIRYDCPDANETILRHDAVFLANIPDNIESAFEQFCYKNSKPVYLQAELNDVMLSTSHQTVLEDSAYMRMRRNEPTLVQRFVKRAFDIAVSLIALILFSPLMLTVSLILKLSGNGSVMFRQERATRGGEVFRIFKFRTMYEESGNFSARQGDDRITPVGRVLRKYRIDELPQFLNVLHGEMSLVGPRPEMLTNVESYTALVPEFRYRQQMKAGITGLAQIEGKYNTSPKDKAILDLLYIEHFSLAYDFKLILRTLTVFFRRDSTEGFGSKTVSCPELRTSVLKDSPESAE